MNRPAKRFLLIPAVLALAVPAAPAAAGTNFWSPLGPEGAQVTALASRRLDLGTLERGLMTYTIP